MKIKVLGSSGTVAHEKNTAAFLIDGFMLFDAGTISRSLSSEGLSRITHIFLTHAHLDHIKGVPFLVENRAMKNSRKFISIYSGRPVIQDLKKHIFNNRIWPDFSKIPSPGQGDHPLSPYFDCRIYPDRPLSHLCQQGQSHSTGLWLFN